MPYSSAAAAPPTRASTSAKCLGTFKTPNKASEVWARRQRARLAEKGLEKVKWGEGFKDHDIIRCTDPRTGFGAA